MNRLRKLSQAGSRGCIEANGIRQVPEVPASEPRVALARYRVLDKALRRVGEYHYELMEDVRELLPSNLQGLHRSPLYELIDEPALKRGA